ncbi:MAG: exodeoxyribonuclease VII small subunit, partial [Proteobacteria bacterium]|nr:exodeoxyribonuclease VII small subunit [Pseudomonadota bacterium]
AIDAYSRGMALKTHCQARLEEARLKVEQIKLPEEGGAVRATPFDPAS